MRGRLRVFILGASHGDLDDLRSRPPAGALEIAGSALLPDVARAAVPIPDAIDAVLLTSAAWRAVSGALAVRGGDEPSGSEEPGEQPILIEDLTPRERDVLVLVAEGRANREIAARLGISEHTVKFHLASVFGKLAVSTRTQAVRRALEWGLIEI